MYGRFAGGLPGSGDAYPGSDIDLRLLLADDAQRPFRSEIIDDVRLEIRHADFERARTRIETRPMDVYGYLDGRIWHDPVGKLAELTAVGLLAEYRAREGSSTLRVGETRKDNDKPMPPVGAVLAHRRDLTFVPEGFDALLDQFFLGGLDERLVASLSLIGWIIGALGGPDEQEPG